MLLSYLKSVPVNLSNQKNRVIIKIPIFDTKNTLLEYFWAAILKKTSVIFEISALELVKNEILTHTVNFGIGFVFSKGLEAAFFEDPDPGVLYKACQENTCFKSKRGTLILTLY